MGCQIRGVLAVGVGLVAVLAAGRGAWAADATIDVKCPYNISYDLKPITIEVTAKGDGDLSYHIYDTFKNELAHGKLEEGTKQSISFTPPKYGWYVIECGTYEKDHMTSGRAAFIGVTPKYSNMHTLEAGESHGGWNDEALQAFSGLLLDRTNTRMGLDHAEKVLAACEKYGVTLLVQFEGAPSAEQVREAVTRFKGRVKNWEIVNEPNFGMNPQSYANLVKTVYPIIKEIDPEATVMGCDTCGIQLGWYDAFYKAGGGKFLDAISIHDYEGHGAIDFFHWNYKLGKLREIMARYGDAKKPIWQTERAIGAAGFTGYGGASQALRITMQRDILETWGVPNDHNNHYYAAVNGYNQVPTWVLSSSGPHQAALACRTRAAMIKGRKFVEKIDFGPTGNKILLGLRYRGDDGQTLTLRNLGCYPDLAVEMNVRGGGSVELVDAFGNTRKVAVSGGKAMIDVSQWPCYVRLAEGQEATVTPWNFGTNIAPQAKFTYSGGTKRDYKILNDGIFQDYFPDHPFGDIWSGSYTGKVLDEKTETLDIEFDKPRPVQRMIVYGVQADNQMSAILDYDLQYWQDGAWTTVDKVHVPCPPSDIVETYGSHDMVWYQTNDCVVHQFKRPVETSKLRMVVRRVSRGLQVDTIVEDFMNRSIIKDHNWHPAANALMLREIEIYGPGK